MHRRSSLRHISRLVSAVALMAGCGSASSGTSSPTTPITPVSPATGEIPIVTGTGVTNGAIAAANAFLASLSTDQRARTAYGFLNTTQRTKWSNFPTGIFQRNGVKLGELSLGQQDLLFALLQATLSADGYKKVQEIVGGDEALRLSSGGGALVFGRAEYYVTILGTPSTSSAWMVQFGGHHLAINIPIIGDTMVMTPSLTATQPASYAANGVTVQPLADEYTKSFALLTALDAGQRARAVLGYSVTDLVLGPGQDGRTLAPEGLPGSAMTAAQRLLLLDLIGEWSGMINSRDAAARTARISADLDNTWFAWSGSTTPGSNSYFRVTGPTVLIEFAPQQGSGQHIHAIYRDPTTEYGLRLVK